MDLGGEPFGLAAGVADHHVLARSEISECHDAVPLQDPAAVLQHERDLVVLPLEPDDPGAGVDGGDPAARGARDLQYSRQRREADLANFNSIMKFEGSLMPRLSPMKFKIMDDEEPFIQINIDLRGIMRVVGGVSYRTKTKELLKLIMVDEGAALLLFQIKGKKALFHGGLNGTEFKRFLNTKPGQNFGYYQRTYTKLTMQEVKDLVDSNIVYYHDVPDNVEDPRRKKCND